MKRESARMERENGLQMSISSGLNSLNPNVQIVTIKLDVR